MGRSVTFVGAGEPTNRLLFLLATIHLPIGSVASLRMLWRWWSGKERKKELLIWMNFSGDWFVGKNNFKTHAICIYIPSISTVSRRVDNIKRCCPTSSKLVYSLTFLAMDMIKICRSWWHQRPKGLKTNGTLFWWEKTWGFSGGNVTVADGSILYFFFVCTSPGHSSAAWMKRTWGPQKL